MLEAPAGRKDRGAAVDYADDEMGPDSEYRAALGKHARSVFGHEGSIGPCSERFVAHLSSYALDNHRLLGALGAYRAAGAAD